MMKRSEQLILLLGSLFLVAQGVICEGHGKGNHIRSLHYIVNPDVKVDQNPVYNQFLLVEQWAGTLCRYTRNTCSKSSSVFTIHGLWPQNTAAWRPGNCCAVPKPTPIPAKCNYSRMAISGDLRGKLNRSWPNLIGDNDEFWDDEWVKHGACSVDELPQTQYFQNANTLYNNSNFNILNILAGAGIRADGSTYTRLSISNALRNGTGFNMGLQCYTNGSRIYLLEVRPCVDRSGTTFQNCNRPKYGRCGDNNVTFPLPY